MILASGLDARGYRLHWPAGMVLFEIDQPEVIAFKAATLAGLGAEPTTDLRTVAVDLRADWPAALAEAGFDATTPTAWIAEGLFGYLPPEAQDRLLDQITELSAPGSRLAAEACRHTRTSTRRRSASGCRSRRPVAQPRVRPQLLRAGVHGRSRRGHRLSAGARLDDRPVPTNDLLIRYGLAPLDDGEGFADVVYVTATK